MDLDKARIELDQMQNALVAEADAIMAELATATENRDLAHMKALQARMHDVRDRFTVVEQIAAEHVRAADKHLQTILADLKDEVDKL